MEAKEKEDQDYGICYIMAVICGVATAWVITGSIAFMLLGAILGLLSAGLFVNVVMRGTGD